MQELKNEVDYSERMLDREKKYGSPRGRTGGGRSSGEDRRAQEGEVEGGAPEKIDELKKERWREQVRAWRDTQDLMREARKLNRVLSDLSLRL
ncbi:hypothetical protein AKJ41_04710, partial [candidate division MSBL1 archaeon SCGC-AAA259O05]